MAARESPVVRHLPNVLTTVRLLAVPAFVAIVVLEGGPSRLAGIVFMAAALTDFLDGFVARRFQVMSQYGKVVDPLADRLLVNSAVFLLCVYDSRWLGGDGRLLGVEFLVVLVRDALAVYGWRRLRRRVIPDVTLLGKAAMALMMAGMAFLLVLPDATWPVWPFELGLAASVVVLVQYVRRYRWVLGEEPAGTAAPQDPRTGPSGPAGDAGARVD